MCEPISMGTLATIATVAGSGISAYGEYQQGKANKQASNYQAMIDARNAQTAKQNAEIERQAGREEANRQRLATAQLIGQQKAAMAANGLDITSGTPLDIISDTAELGELDALMLEYNADKRARNYEIQSSNFSAQSGFNSMAAKNAYKTGVYNAGGTMLGGIGSVSRQWTKY